MNSQAEDDDQFRALCHWRSGKADARRRTDGQSKRTEGVRWLFFWAAGLSLAGLLLMGLSVANAGGTVTDSKYIWLQRSGVTLTDKTTPKLACPVNTMTECMACMVEMYDEERRRRTSGYVTYRCMDVSQSYVKFSKTAPPPPPPPVASLQVYACADAGADGRILESATVSWPNCVTASYQNPSKALVVAINPDSPPLMWRLASKLTDERIWTQTDGVGAWTRATAINWGTTPPPPPPPAGSGNLTWTPSPSPNVAGYRLLYGTSPDALTLSIDVIPPEPRVYKVPGLKAGQLYHFRMQAYDSGGVHGPLSNLLSVTIQ